MTADNDWQKFIKLCHNVKNPKLLTELFDLFLTLEEKEMLKARYAIICALMKGEISQREVGKKYAVSIAQITRGSNALKTISKDLKTFLSKNFKEEGGI